MENDLCSHGIFTGCTDAYQQQGPQGKEAVSYTHLTYKNGKVEKTVEYILVEIKAPNGYELSSKKEEIRFCLLYTSRCV